MKITAVYLLAGMSSRFGGRIKGLARIGPHDETLLELSLRDAKEVGFSPFVFVVSKPTYGPIHESFGDAFEGIPISYCFQEKPADRKPWGTTDALLSAHTLVHGPFMVLNGDDIYGKGCLQKVHDFMQDHPGSYCMPAYKLGKVLSDTGTVNRGFIYAPDGVLDHIDETFNISTDDVPGKYAPEQPCSQNLFALQSDFLAYAARAVPQYKKEHARDLKAECLLPVTLTHFIKEKNIQLFVIPVDDEWMGLTNPADEELVRARLKNQ